MRLKWITAVGALLSLAAIAGAQAQAFPSRPVRILVNTAPGGLVDVSARLVAQKMSEQLGQPVIVENRPGADGLLGIRAVKAAPADGYTLLATSNTIVLLPAGRNDTGYDPTRDFAGVGPLIRLPSCWWRLPACR